MFLATPLAPVADGGVITVLWKIPPSQPTHTVEAAAGPVNSMAYRSAWAPAPAQLGSAAGLAMLAGRKLNVQLPAGVTGLAVPIVLNIGGTNTQGGVTLAFR